MRRKRLTTVQRSAFYKQACGTKEYPDCNICGFAVTPGQKWVESHMPVMQTLGGTETGVAHKRCNDERWAKVEAPMLAKLERVHNKHRDIHVSRFPMRGGKEEPWKRTVDGRIVDRITGEAWKPKAS